MTRPVIVGAGLAGLATALDLADRGVPTLLLTGGGVGAECASDWAQGGLAAAVGVDDSPALHAADTLAAGAGLCDPAIVDRVTAAAPGVVARLLALGARLDRDAAGALRLGLEGAHSRHRIVHADGDGSGRELTRATVAAARACPLVTLAEHTRARRLLLEDGKVVGLLAQDANGPRPVATNAVVLATGGLGSLYAQTTNPRGSRGSGLALGLRAGARVRDLELVQFHPTALHIGLEPMPLVSEAVRGEGAHLVTGDGGRILADDLAPRDVVSRAVWAHLDAGRSVYLDTPRAIGAGFGRRFPAITAACAQAGLDPATELLPVRPAAHYHMGGLLVDDEGRTDVPGLWAVGEVSSTGLHGANRLASNSLLEAVACAQWVADSVAAAGATHPCLDAAAARAAEREITAGGLRTGAPDPQARHVLTRVAGVLRDGASLRRGLAALRPGAEHNDARLVSALLLRAALSRPESRGGHWRTDHPGQRPPRHTLVCVDDLDVDLTQRTAS